MDLFEMLLERYHIITILSWFLTVFSCIQLYYSIKCAVVQRHFFKHNNSKEIIHERSNGILLKYSLDIISTLDNKKESTIIPIFATVVFVLVLLLGSESLVQTISFVVAILSFFAWLLTSRWNNRIVKQIDNAKPTIRK